VQNNLAFEFEQMPRRDLENDGKIWLQ
jgi:hypothetical protein